MSEHTDYLKRQIARKRDTIKEYSDYINLPTTKCGDIPTYVLGINDLMVIVKQYEDQLHYIQKISREGS